MNSQQWIIYTLKFLHCPLFPRSNSRRLPWDPATSSNSDTHSSEIIQLDSHSRDKTYHTEVILLNRNSESRIMTFPHDLAQARSRNRLVEKQFFRNWNLKYHLFPLFFSPMCVANNSLRYVKSVHTYLPYLKSARSQLLSPPANVTIEMKSQKEEESTSLTQLHNTYFISHDGSIQNRESKHKINNFVSAWLRFDVNLRYSRNKPQARGEIVDGRYHTLSPAVFRQTDRCVSGHQKLRRAVPRAS